jgi:hypothetical protein
MVHAFLVLHSESICPGRDIIDYKTYKNGKNKVKLLVLGDSLSSLEG